ncbi:hypothetical protein ACFL20_12615 [Spirochaetota bacterium]
MFNWENNPEINRYKFQIARDDDFKQILKNAVVKNNFYNLKGKYSTGKYYWRVTGIYRDGSFTEISKSRSVKILESETIRISSPANKTELTTTEREIDEIEFSWKKTKFSGAFILKLSRSKSFQKPYKQLSTYDNSLDVDDVPWGNYFWKLVQIDKGGNIVNSSPTYKLNIKRILSRPRVYDPPNGEVIDMSDKNDITFKWAGPSDANNYKIVIFSKNKKYPILSKTTGKTNFSIKNLDKFNEGSFYWSIQAFTRDNKNRIVHKSPPMQSNFTLTLKEKLTKPKIVIQNLEKPKIVSPKTLYKVR